MNNGPETKPDGLHLPSALRPGYNAIRVEEPEFADLYARHFLEGDPLADRAVAELAEVAADGAGSHALISGALRDPYSMPPDTPPLLRQLVEECSVVPGWFDEELAQAGCRAFHRNAETVLGALSVGAIVEGFSTLISKSFRIRGRIFLNGVRRLKQNILHLVEQYMPGGILPGGDGWRLTLRVRLVHAQSRKLLLQAPEWEHDVYGLPVSTAHMLLAAATFSGRLCQHARSLGARISDEECEGYVHVWRLTGLYQGIPESLLFTDWADSLRVFALASKCEPEPDTDAIIMANSIINSAPLLAGITDGPKRRKAARDYYQLSRELIGDELADKFRFPTGMRLKRLPLFRLKQRMNASTRNWLPFMKRRYASHYFKALAEVLDLGTMEHSYELPSAVYDEDSEEW